eukprot:8242693-Prorocentrum_lima.AAC.1
MVQRRKVTPEDAKKLYVASATNVAHNLSKLEAWTQEQKNEASEAEIQMAAVLLEKKHGSQCASTPS